ncbi:hypothetical protein FRB90_012421, partial [Tulasnella sp. 427]
MIHWARIGQLSSLLSCPPEIIILVLHHLVTDDRILGRRYDDLIRASTSFSYLRQLALSTPTLWTHIEITDKPASFELAKACLQRSGSHEVEVAIRIARRTGAKLPGVIALLRHVAGRTRELRLDLGLAKETEWSDLRNAMASLDAPVLKCMELNLWNIENPREALTRSIELPTRATMLQSLTLVKL